MVVIKKEKELLINKKHPWLYRGAIEDIRGNPENGDIVPVCTKDGSILCYGFYSTQSLIAVRIISFGPEKPPDNWIHTRIRNAYHLRKNLFIPSNGYRLINAEGDFIPGLIVDVYNKTIVVRPLIRGIEKNISNIIDILLSLFPENKIVIKRDEYSARKENIAIKNGYIKEKGEGLEQIEEDGLIFSIDILEGQKTGFYLDQRDARIHFSSYCHNKTVLNLFSYTGAFTFHAAKGGAKKVISVEQSKKALEFAAYNMDNNPGLKTAFEWIQDDVFHFLPASGIYDVIICDPPPFARKKQEVNGALKGYGFLHRNAFEHLSDKSWLFTFSCSGAVSRDLFFKTLQDAAVQTGRDVRIIRELHSSPDHPFSLVHPQGEYLKGWAVYVQ
ncbi:MAG: class I SAM-dependent rRNA methyltransferase [Spirochaetales bacterium]|nr:class I SAM-dependent rRNA methyltransferase [Spirochaetales bacterium]